MGLIRRCNHTSCTVEDLYEHARVLSRSSVPADAEWTVCVVWYIDVQDPYCSGKWLQWTQKQYYRYIRRFWWQCAVLLGTIFLRTVSSNSLWAYETIVTITRKLLQGIAIGRCYSQLQYIVVNSVITWKLQVDWYTMYRLSYLFQGVNCDTKYLWTN